MHIFTIFLVPRVLWTHILPPLPPHCFQESGTTFKIARAPLSARGESALGNLSARGATSALGPSAPVAATPVAAPSLPPLPPGWQQLQDPSGKAYYFNPDTETTQWARPAPVAEVSAAAISVVVAEEVSSAPAASSPTAGTLKAASAFKRLVGAKGASSDAQPAVATAPAAAVASAAEASTPAASPASASDALAEKAVLAFRGKHFRQGSSSMKEYAFPDTKETFQPLPKGFTGAENLQLPHYLRTRASGVTLPSRLEVLGNNEYKIASTLTAASIGNAVVVCLHY